jgi:hypothetical protein
LLHSSSLSHIGCVRPANYGFMRRVSDGARTRILLSSATFRFHPLQYLLVRPVIGLICRYYGVFGDSEDYLCPPRSGSYQPGCSKVAVIGPPAGYGKSALMEYDKGTGRGAGWSLVSPWFLLLAATSARPERYGEEALDHEVEVEPWGIWARLTTGPLPFTSL